MYLFAATAVHEYGLNCDCCVSTERFEADVFATSEEEAKQILTAAGAVRVEKLQNDGPIKKIRVSGIKINQSHEIYKGFYADSPLQKAS